MAAEELPMIQENSSQSCGGNTRIGRKTRYSDVLVKRQRRVGRPVVEMDMNEQPWET